MNVLADPSAVASAGADLVSAALREGAQTLAVSGGRTPRELFELLTTRDLEWGRVILLFADERAVAPADAEANYRLVRDTLLARVTPGAVIRVPGELGADRAASWYDAQVGRLQPLDLVLLGMGEDGHCASLFPGNPAVGAPGWAVAVHDAPKPPPDRVSLTLGCLRNARRVVFLVTGADKAEALRRAQRGEVPAGLIPNAEWLVDQAAAS
jgi:6-phosphogluconolactonase